MLEYEPDSYAGPFDENSLHEFEAWLNRSGDFGGRFRFDPSYVDHLRIHHGGVPKQKCFATKAGTVKVITRFLHFSTFPAGHPLRDSGVKRSWSLTDDRLGGVLMPFADLFAGDMLCFDYSKPGRPRVVVWFHERSPPDEKPYTELVAENFDEFLTLPYELPPAKPPRKKPKKK